jgi:hypothetical protein
MPLARACSYRHLRVLLEKGSLRLDKALPILVLSSRPPRWRKDEPLLVLVLCRFAAGGPRDRSEG